VLNRFEDRSDRVKNDRHPAGVGDARAQGRGDDDDGRPRPETAVLAGAEPGRPATVGCRRPAREGAVMSKLRPRSGGRDPRIRQTCRSGGGSTSTRRRVVVRARDGGVRESWMTELDDAAR
jgi:hypothetical protein